MSKRKLSAPVVCAIAVALAPLPATAKPMDVWKKLADNCGAKLGQDVYDGRLTYFGPMNSYGAGSIFRDKGKKKIENRLVNTALPTPPALPIVENVQTCQNNAVATLGGKAGIEATAPQIKGSGSIAGYKVQSVTIEPSQIGWVSIDGLQFDNYYNGLVATVSDGADPMRLAVHGELERPDTLLLTRAMVVKDVKITYVLAAGLSGAAQADIKNALSSVASGKADVSASWTSSSTVVITQKGTSYLFGLLQPFEGATPAASSLGGVMTKSVLKSFSAKPRRPRPTFGEPVKAKPDGSAVVTQLPD